MPSEELIEIDEALAKLGAENEDLARIVKLRYFAGLQKTEVAEVLGISPSTVNADRLFARTWLKKRLG